MVFCTPASIIPVQSPLNGKIHKHWILFYVAINKAVVKQRFATLHYYRIFIVVYNNSPMKLLGKWPCMYFI